MSLNNSSKVTTALVIGAVIFVVAFAMLLVLGDYRFVAAVFLAALLAFLTTIVLYLAFGWGESEPYGAAQGNEKPASASTATAAASAGAAAETTDTSAADADAARKAAEAEAARKAAEAEVAKQAAEAQAAEKAEAARAEQARLAAAQAESEAARAKKAEAEAARMAADAESATPSGSAGLGEDYDGDGIHEGTNEGTRPAGLDAPRDGKADDLKMIKGVGPKMEKLCNSLGFWHFDQVASWTADEVAWVDANLQGFKGRVSRDTWVEQARLLAAGGETEFSKRVEGGDVY